MPTGPGVARVLHRRRPLSLSHPSSASFDTVRSPSSPSSSSTSPTPPPSEPPSTTPSCQSPAPYNTPGHSPPCLTAHIPPGPSPTTPTCPAAARPRPRPRRAAAQRRPRSRRRSTTPSASCARTSPRSPSAASASTRSRTRPASPFLLPRLPSAGAPAVWPVAAAAGGGAATSDAYRPRRFRTDNLAVSAQGFRRGANRVRKVSFPSLLPRTASLPRIHRQNMW